MEQGIKSSPEFIKKMIDIESENLRFYQSFFLPIGTGLITLLFTYKNIPTGIVIGLFLVGIFALFFLSLVRKKVLKRIFKLTESLKV